MQPRLVFGSLCQVVKRIAEAPARMFDRLLEHIGSRKPRLSCQNATKDSSKTNRDSFNEACCCSRRDFPSSEVLPLV